MSAMSPDALSANIKLPVPAYSQMDPKWGFEPGTERSMCGIICVTALAEYYADRTGKKVPSVPQLLGEVKRAGGWKAEGISHAVEVSILKELGLLAWRRNWGAPGSDPQWFTDNEGYDAEQVAAVSAQQAAEASISGKQAQELQSIQAALQAGNPVVASVRAGFGDNKVDHQVILAGWEHDAGGDSFWVMDPERPPGSPVYKDPSSHFFTYFNNRAIFVQFPPAP